MSVTQEAVGAKADAYQVVTNRIIEQLEKGVCPWSLPWKGGAACRPLRWNGKPYRGMNVIELWMTAEEKGYDSAHWLTFKQALDLGGAVRKGEKSARVVFWDVFEKPDRDCPDIKVKIPFLKLYSVFNAQQCDGLPPEFTADPDPENQPTPFERIKNAWTFFRETGATIVEGGSRAYYERPPIDRICIPDQSRFFSADAHASTAAHELIHWTGSPNRSERKKGGRFGDADYAREELVAELGAAFLCADLGIENEPREDHASYLQAWLNILKSDKRAIFAAASAAERAVKYLHDLQPAWVECVD